MFSYYLILNFSSCIYLLERFILIHLSSSSRCLSVVSSSEDLFIFCKYLSTFKTCPYEVEGWRRSKYLVEVEYSSLGITSFWFTELCFLILGGSIGLSSLLGGWMMLVRIEELWMENISLVIMDRIASWESSESVQQVYSDVIDLHLSHLACDFSSKCWNLFG